MQLPIQIDRGSGTSLQVQLAKQLRELILGGLIKSGAALPGSREMALNLKLSRNTVLLSYDQLTIEGLLEPRAAKGTFVSKRVRGRIESNILNSVRSVEGPKYDCAFDSPANVSIDFAFDRQSADTFPSQTWRRLILKKLAHAGSSAAHYSEPSGLLDLRQAIADHLGPARGINVHRDQVIVVGGIQEALNVICRSFPMATTPVVVEDPVSPGLRRVFESYSARVVPVSTDRQGLRTDLLPHHQSGGFIYLTPSHQFPTGGTLPVSRRAKLLQWAEQNNSLIIENDQDSDFCYDNPPLISLAGMTHSENVIHIGDFSKSIGGGVHIGYMIVPPHAIVSAMAAKAIFNNGISWLDQAVLADFIKSGAYAKHLRRVQRIYRSRRDILIEALKYHFNSVDITGQQSGTHILWQLPFGWPTGRELDKRVRSHGVRIYSLHREFDGSSDNMCARSDTAVIMGYSSLTESSIKRGIQKISDAIADLANVRRASH
jgi:GntR family transcriptional regulator / MocR family aminotransferase